MPRHTYSFDVKSADLQQSLKEIMLWCADRQLTPTPAEKEEIRRVRELREEAGALLHDAMSESRSLLNRIRRREYSSMPKYQRGMELLSKADPVSSISFAKWLRSPELKPEVPLSQCIQRERVVRSVVSTRSARAVGMRRQFKSPSEGRLLLYWPDRNLADGAAEYASIGFFDVDNTPPWDVWVAFSGNALLSWVPAELVDSAGRGIDANPEGCIAWFE
jgi:hypothetical protein